MFSFLPTFVWVLYASGITLGAPHTEQEHPQKPQESTSVDSAPKSASSSQLSSSVSSKPSSPSAIPSSATSRPRPTNAPGKKNAKRGLAFAAGNTPADILNANQSASALSWQYNWANIPPAYLATSNIPFVPMQWGSGAVAEFVDAVRAQGSDVILGFNEPDYSNEANMDPVEAASLWKAYIEPLKEHGVRLGGPAVTASGTGRPWLHRFFEACSDCTIDFLPVHWYGTGVTGFYDYLWSIHNDFPEYPIWVTEYADTSSNDTEVYTFMNETLRYLDDLEWVERYAWFGFFRPQPDVHYNLLREDGGLNALGELYVGAETVHTHIYSDTAFAGYKTVNGADDPNQALPTAFPAMYGAASRGRNILGENGVRLLVSLTAVITGSLMGAFWSL